MWCETGTGPAQTVYPRGIAYSPADDTFFIVDRQARIQHLDRAGKFICEWHTPESQQGKPVGLTVGPDGNLWVPDTHYHRVLVSAPDGRETWTTSTSAPRRLARSATGSTTRSDAHGLLTATRMRLIFPLLNGDQR